MSDSSEKIKKITHLVLDVDGTLTDSGLFFESDGMEFKKFSSRDYVGVMASHYLGWRVMIVTGRESEAVKKRAGELRIDELHQNVKNKVGFIEKYMRENDISSKNLAYIGDDLNDYGAMKRFAGFKACPSDAAPEVKEICDYVSTFKGGTGVVQDVMRYVLKELGRWDEFMESEVEAGY